jgi:hypothetical protein
MSVSRSQPGARKLPAPPSVIDPNQRYSLPESAATLRLSMPTLYKRMAAGQIEVIRDGARTYVHGTELIRQSAPKQYAQTAA